MRYTINEVIKTKISDDDMKDYKASDFSYSKDGEVSTFIINESIVEITNHGNPVFTADNLRLAKFAMLYGMSDEFRAKYR